MATKPTSVTLGDHFQGFVEGQISDGRFTNISEVVRAGLRLLEDEESKLKALRTALAEGLASGPAAALDWDDFKAGLHKEHETRTA